MNENRKAEIRQADKKYGKKFAFIMAAALLVGVVFGIASVCLMEMDQSYLDHLSLLVIPIIADVVMWVAMVIGFPLAAAQFSKAKALSALAGPEDDAAEEQIERGLNVNLTITTILQILVFTCFGMAASVSGSLRHGLSLSKELYLVITVSALCALLLCLVLTLVFQRQTVNFIKERNPEKQGSIFQTDFNKTWLKSCDEAEKAQAYESAFKAYRVGIYTSLVVWVITIFAAMIGWTNWFSVLIVGIIWGALQISYCFFCLKKSNQASIFG